MDIVSTILSGAIYDMFKKGTTLALISLKESIKSWIVDENLTEQIAQEVLKLELNDEMSEKAIVRKLEESESLMKLLEVVANKENKVVEITQKHSGKGDNIIGNITL